MVVISLYRGNLHRVSNAPRRWRIPPQSFSLSQFKLLMRKRSEALSRLATASRAIANPNFNNEKPLKPEEKGAGGGGEIDKLDTLKRQDSFPIDPQPSNFQPDDKEHTREDRQFHEPNVGVSASFCLVGAAAAREEDVHDSRPGGAGKTDGHLEEQSNPDVASEKNERKQELEKQLHVLNEKKHNLVQMLKQILNAEEEIKRRSTQSPVARPSLPHKADMAVENSAAKQLPKLTVEVNFGSDSGGESDAAANHSNHVRQLNHIHITSPSATPLARTTFSSFQHNAGVQNNRGSMVAMGHGPPTPSSLMSGAMASPSRFAPAGHQSQTTSLPAMALPANHFMASSPSPAVSGGTSSVFRDPRATNSS
ncbi:uncharacterized protein LOC121982547 [Zingiber officinale]|uniref:Uncharacterized protein n=1 Tax=Zingiber officinale TaxID=94328 RepID=A0A8J5LD41_ZINOF|nr:uncharacterized protein LOC121982547 [Zingiber officinale]KAG6509301.1 hypothetical protein ZIOFF_034694 [Zingiber officinale]